MADTQQSMQDLLDGLADNCSGQITPQLLRDMLISLNLSAGFMWLTSSVENEIDNAGTFYKINGTTEAPYLNRFTHSNNRLTFVGGAPLRVFVLANPVASIEQGSEKQLAVRIAKNGTTEANSESHRHMNSSNDIGAIPSFASFLLEPDDYIEVFISNETDDVDVTVEHMQVLAFGQNQ